MTINIDLYIPFNILEGEKMEGSILLFALAGKSKPHCSGSSSYAWSLLCVNQ